MKRIAALLCLIAVTASAQQRVVFSDGTVTNNLTNN